MKVNISLAKSDWDTLLSAVFEYGYTLDLEQVDLIEKIDRSRCRFEAMMNRQLKKPKYLLRDLKAR
jgi:hypothetical protein